jgi:hypothetical protein
MNTFLLVAIQFLFFGFGLFLNFKPAIHILAQGVGFYLVRCGNYCKWNPTDMAHIVWGLVKTTKKAWHISLPLCVHAVYEPFTFGWVVLSWMFLIVLKIAQSCNWSWDKFCTSYNQAILFAGMMNPALRGDSWLLGKSNTNTNADLKKTESCPAPAPAPIENGNEIPNSSQNNTNATSATMVQRQMKPPSKKIDLSKFY